MENKIKEVCESLQLFKLAQYRYDRLISDFADHYLTMQRSGYEPLPNGAPLMEWIRHLYKEINPKVFALYEKILSHFGMSLGNRIILENPKAKPVDFYPVRIDYAAGEGIIWVHGFAAKKDGKQGTSPALGQLNDKSKVTMQKEKLNPSLLQEYLFETSSRLNEVKEFVAERLNKM